MQIYVNHHHQEIQDGSRERPYATISRAAEAAMPGDEVIVFPGVYREWVRLPRGGTDNSRRIIWRSFLPYGAVISGAEPVTGWEALGGGVYRAAVEELPADGQLYRNGQALRKAGPLEPLARNTWRPALKDGRAAVLAHLGGLNPEPENMELSVRPACFSPARTGADYITLSGFRLEKTAGEEDGENGAVRCGNGWTITECEIRHGGGSGVSLLPSEKEEPGSLTIADCSLYGFPRAGVSVCSERLSVTVRSCHIHHCGAGVTAQAARSVLLTGCHVRHCATGAALGPGVRSACVSACAFHHNGKDLSAEGSGAAEAQGSLFLSGLSFSGLEGAFRPVHSLFSGRLETPDGEYPGAMNLFAGPDGGSWLVQDEAGAVSPLNGVASLNVLGGEGRWVLRTDLPARLRGGGGERAYPAFIRFPPEHPENVSEAPSSMPGPFPAGTPGALILGNGDLP